MVNKTKKKQKMHKNKIKMTKCSSRVCVCVCICVSIVCEWSCLWNFCHVSLNLHPKQEMALSTTNPIIPTGVGLIKNE